MRTFAKLLAIGCTLVAVNAAAQVVMYEGENFHGRSFVASGPIWNFERTGFNDRARSVIVERGRWEACEDARFGGYCTLLGPGQYPSLRAMGLNNRISSIRPVSGQSRYQPAPPPPPPAYTYYPRPQERLYQAQVVAVRAVVGPPQQQCWVEPQQVVRPDPGASIAGAVVGGVLGGVLGHQIGGGTGRDVATALGAVGGAAVGANVAGRHGQPQVYTQNVQRCQMVAGPVNPDYYDVTYVFRGVEHRAQLAFAPGPTITVNQNGEPRV